MSHIFTVHDGPADKFETFILELPRSNLDSDRNPLSEDFGNFNCSSRQRRVLGTSRGMKLNTELGW